MLSTNIPKSLFVSTSSILFAFENTVPLDFFIR